VALAAVRVLPARDVAAGQEGKVYSWRRTSRVGWGAKAPAPAAATRQSAEPQVASPQVVRLCLREGVCVYFGCAASDKRLYGGGTRAASSILQYTAVYCSILQYTAVYCSILRCFWICFLFFGHWGVAGLVDKKDENGSMNMCWCWITMVAPCFKKSFKIRSWVPSPQMPYFGGHLTSAT